MASGDKIYVARQDTLENVQNTANAIKENIGNSNDATTAESLFGGIKAIKESVDGMNSSYGTDDFMPLDQIIAQSSAKFIDGEIIEDTMIQIPFLVKGMYVTACGGGGGGGSATGSNNTRSSGGAGGGGGAAINHKFFSIDKAQYGKSIQIKIGKGGAGGSYDTDGDDLDAESGTATVIGEFITLPGGKGGENEGGAGGTAGGSGGGNGGTYKTNGSAGITGAGGTASKSNNADGGGGGGSLGKGGNGGVYSGSKAPTDGLKGGGGGGAYGRYRSNSQGAKGGDGYVYIEFVWDTEGAI